MGSPLHAEASKWVSKVLKLANDHIWRSWKVGHKAYIQKGWTHHGESFADTNAQGRSVQQTIAFYPVILESRRVTCGLNPKNVLQYFVKRRLPSFQWCGFSSLLLSETDTGRGRSNLLVILNKHSWQNEEQQREVKILLKWTVHIAFPVFSFILVVFCLHLYLVELRLRFWGEYITKDKVKTTKLFKAIISFD